MASISRDSRSVRLAKSGAWRANENSALAPSRASVSRPRGPRLPAIQSPTTGSAVFHMLKAGSSVRATPSTTTMVFCSSTSSGRVCMSNSSVTSNSSVSSRAIEMVSAGWPWIGSPIARIAWAKAATSCVDGT